jgi:hypothetical protein
MMRLAITLVCLASALAANGDPHSPEVESLFPGIKPSEEISREELREKLLHMKRDGLQNFVELLFATKDKDSTEIFNGLTAAKLIKQAYINVYGCSKRAFRARASLYDKVAPVRHGADVVFNGQIHYFVALYLITAIDNAAKYCLERKGEVFAKGITNKKFMEGITKAVEWDAAGGKLPSRLISWGTTSLIHFITHPWVA